MKCLSCKHGDMQPDKAAYFAQLKKCYVIIENVPCFKCRQCGEIYYTASVSTRIEEILESVEKIASKIFIMDYSTAA